MLPGDYRPAAWAPLKGVGSSKAEAYAPLASMRRRTRSSCLMTGMTGAALQETTLPVPACPIYEEATAVVFHFLGTGFHRGYATVVLVP